MKKLTALTIVLTLALLFASCGGNPHSKAQAGDTIQLGNINWLVLAVEGGKALVLSEKVMENRAYRPQGINVNWENCSLREFLNGSFYNSAFSEQEKKWIVESQLINANNPQYGTSGGNSTKDKVFLLSIDEVNKYMGDGAHVNIRNAKKTDSGWWLRSPGGISNYAAYVNGDGDVRVLGLDAAYTGGGVRPALWLKL